ncbi:MAG: hypothetical protein ABI780_05500 [Ardenticatenales bacterium]
MCYVLAIDIVEEVVENMAMPPVGILLAPEIVLNVSILIVPLAALYAQIYRYRNVSTPRERQQTNWVVAGVSVALSVFVLTAVAFFSGAVDRTSMPQILVRRHGRIDLGPRPSGAGYDPADARSLGAMAALVAHALDTGGARNRPSTVDGPAGGGVR